LEQGERDEKGKVISMFAFKKEKYEKVIKLAKEEWILSTDGG
jgi:hypothetical protein